MLKLEALIFKLLKEFGSVLWGPHSRGEQESNLHYISEKQDSANEEDNENDQDSRVLKAEILKVKVLKTKVSKAKALIFMKAEAEDQTLMNQTYETTISSANSGDSGDSSSSSSDESDHWSRKRSSKCHCNWVFSSDSELDNIRISLQYQKIKISLLNISEDYFIWKFNMQIVLICESTLKLIQDKLKQSDTDICVYNKWKILNDRAVITIKINYNKKLQ